MDLCSRSLINFLRKMNKHVRVVGEGESLNNSAQVTGGKEKHDHSMLHRAGHVRRVDQALMIRSL